MTNSLKLSERNVSNWIEHVIEPRKLILAWQAPDHFGDRFRWAVGELHRRTNEDAYLRYFVPGEEFERFNSGKNFEELQARGYQGYPAFSPDVAVHESNVLAAFMRRLPPNARKDFEEYRSFFRLRKDTKLSNFALLGLTEAKLPNDGFSLVNTFENDVNECELFLEVAGFRYYAKNAPLPEALGEPVEFIHEPDNKRDAQAVMVRLRGICIGYINRLQAPTFLKWIAAKRVSGVVERLNGQVDKPRAFIFVRVMYPLTPNRMSGVTIVPSA